MDTPEPRALLQRTFLGAHPLGDDKVVIRSFRPGAESVAVVLDDERTEMTLLHPEGIF